MAKEKITVNEMIPNDILPHSHIDNLTQLTSGRLHPATAGNRYREPQPNIRWSFRKSCRRGRGRILRAKGVEDTTRKPTESINLGP